MRLFAGIELDQTTRDACERVQDRLRAANFESRFEPVEKLHVTLAFLGRVDEAQREDVEAILDDVAMQHTPFDLTLDKLGAFPHEQRPRVIYIGSRAQGVEFRSLAMALRDRYAAMGFTFDDDVVAHVTIARVKGGAPRPVPLLHVGPQQLHVARVALFESLPGQRTTRYVVRQVRDLLAQ